MASVASVEQARRASVQPEDLTQFLVRRRQLPVEGHDEAKRDEDHVGSGSLRESIGGTGRFSMGSELEGCIRFLASALARTDWQLVSGTFLLRLRQQMSRPLPTLASPSPLASAISPLLAFHLRRPHTRRMTTSIPAQRPTCRALRRRTATSLPAGSPTRTIRWPGRSLAEALTTTTKRVWSGRNC